MPISAPRPNSPPSVKRVDAFVYTHAESIMVSNLAESARLSVMIASEWCVLWVFICSIASSSESTMTTDMM